MSNTNPLLDPSTISWDFDGLEILNGKRSDVIRTPTEDELAGFADGDADVWDFMSRTLAEQDGLVDGTFKLSADVQGTVDDWFTLLNLGSVHRARQQRHPRNHQHRVRLPAELRAGRRGLSGVPRRPGRRRRRPRPPGRRELRAFVRMWVDGQPIGSEIVSDGPVELELDVQAPSWIRVDRVELYENGTLIREWEVEDTTDVVRFSETLELTPTKDSWYVAVAAGDGDLAPIFTPVEIPYIELQSVVTEALGGIEAVSTLLDPAIPIPQQYAIRPYALTNPILGRLRRRRVRRSGRPRLAGGRMIALVAAAWAGTVPIDGTDIVIEEGIGDRSSRCPRPPRSSETPAPRRSTPTRSACTSRWGLPRPTRSR